MVGWEIITLVLFGMVLLFLATGIPVAVALGISGIISAYIFLGNVGLTRYVFWEANTHFVLLAVPLFVFMGEVLLYGGLSDRLYDGSAALLGRLPGGLLHANIVSCAIFSAISGSSVATSATIGTIAIPQLEKRGYDSRISRGSLAAGGTLGILIPPSIALIIYGAMTGQNIALLFIAGILPGIMLAALFMLYILVRVITRPQLAPKPEKMSLKRRVLSIISMWPIAVIMLMVLGGIYMGVVTPTEAAAVGAFLALFFAGVYRRLNWATLKKCLLAAVKTNAMIMFIYSAALMLAATMGILRVTDNILLLVSSLPISPLAVLMLIYFMYLVMGSFMDTLAMMVFTLPFVFPIISNLGFDPIWFGVVLVILVELGCLTPPVGINVYVIHGLFPDRPMSEVFMGIIPFFFMMLVGLAIVTVFPQIATWLPATMG